MSSHPVPLAARPLPLDLDPATTAVVVVDMQNHFAAAGGSWSMGGVDTTAINDLVPAIGRVIAAARRSGMPVIYLTAPVPAVPDPIIMPPQAFRGTGRARWENYLRSASTGRSTATSEPRRAGWNSDVVDLLTPEPHDLVIVKPSFSGFFRTDLHDRLQEASITTLLFTGCTTSICVESTLRDAVFRDYECILLDDCVAEPVGRTLDRTNHDATVHLVETVLGWVSDSTTIVDAVDAATTTAATTTAAT
jgi:ureidoacrylate peracid hydrolase